MDENEDKQSVRTNKWKKNIAKQFKIKVMAYDRSYAETQQKTP